MYLAIVIALMLVLPIASGLIDVFFGNNGAFALGIFLKWFVFWSVGMRLLLAGLRQIFQPKYTAEVILGIKSADSLFLVRELGFANAAIGSAGLGSLLVSSWITPVALTGAIFYGLAGINHCFHKNRNALQNLALVSDLFAGLLLFICFFS